MKAAQGPIRNRQAIARQSRPPEATCFFEGLVFLPDISGFTELVRSTDPATGQHITYELLSVILENNRLNLEIAEIEGDAVFFYTRGGLPGTAALYEQFLTLKTAFDNRIAELQEQYHMPLPLQLKAIAHYGILAEYSIGGFRKLYGEVVIEAHRLLKNGVPGRSYLLLTDQLIAATGNTATVLPIAPSGQLCEYYTGLRHLCFSYRLFETPSYPN